MKKFLITTAILAASGSAAMAGGLTAPVVEPVIAPVVVHTPLSFGSWEGGYIGGNIGYADTNFAGIDDIDGMTAAIRGGYDWQFGRGVFGLGAEYDLGKTEGNGITVDKAVTIFGRGGVDMGQWMPYGSVGYTMAKADRDGLGVDLDGYTLAVGAEYKINENWSGYGEYSVSEFGDVTEFGEGVDIQTDKIKLGVNYRF